VGMMGTGWHQNISSSDDRHSISLIPDSPQTQARGEGSLRLRLAGPRGCPLRLANAFRQLGMLISSKPFRFLAMLRLCFCPLPGVVRRADSPTSVWHVESRHDRTWMEERMRIPL
jgi:hypothetical protein